MKIALPLLACLLFAACAAPAAQDGAQQPAASSTAPRHVSMPRTGGPLPPSRVVDMACKVDADCTAKPHCEDTQCRCVQDKCLAWREAVDPVIDPAPASSVR